MMETLLSFRSVIDQQGTLLYTAILFQAARTVGELLQEGEVDPRSNYMLLPNPSTFSKTYPAHQKGGGLLSYKCVNRHSIFLLRRFLHST